MIAVVDTGGANLTSLFRAIERLGRSPTLISGGESLARFSHVVLPGVGAAGEAMRRLRSSGLADRISSAGVPVLGICLGMQLLFENLDENETDGLGVLSGSVNRLVASDRLPVPHMGWSRLRWQKDSELSKGLDEGAYFYFVHSFAVGESPAAVADARHGRNFTAVVEKENFFGTQFHPERSGKPGSQLMKNFLAL